MRAFFFWLVVCSVGWGAVPTADPHRVLLLFTDVPTDAQFFLNGVEAPNRITRQQNTWEFRSDEISAGQTAKLLCAFHFSDGGKPFVAEMEFKQRGGEVLQIAFRSLTRKAVAGPVEPTRPAGQSDRGTIRLLVTKNTKLTINDSPSSQEGERREFMVLLKPGETATYRFSIDFRDNTGRQVIRAKSVTVKGGDVVDLTLKDFIGMLTTSGESR